MIEICIRDFISKKITILWIVQFNLNRKLHDNNFRKG
jgi:hypothetical protein